MLVLSFCMFLTVYWLYVVYYDGFYIHRPTYKAFLFYIFALKYELNVLNPFFCHVNKYIVSGSTEEFIVSCLGKRHVCTSSSSNRKPFYN